MKRYFRLYFDDDETKWKLSVPWNVNGQKIDVWSYVSCRQGQRDPSPSLAIVRDGYRAEFNFTVGEGVPVVTSRIADILQHLAAGDFERIPVKADDGTPLEIINVLRKVDCLDHRKSIGEYHPTTHHEIPGVESRAGRIKLITQLVIDSARTEGANLFRISDWRPPLVASESVVNALQDADVTGIVFQPILVDAPPGKMLIRRGNELIPWSLEERQEWLKSQASARPDTR